ncbi:phosphopantetheine-binding protein [Adhaeribacter aquaticus]|uniref:phosphopantetheine-binding protein n=1 Tax=Adhaeribacter aquaticus TaxID=299567 RepID=UPI000427649F|nr:phosphopantetheine-binding protein [Adhaeribacter aquaticus]
MPMVTYQSHLLRQDIAQIIHRQKGIPTSRILTKSFQQLGFDLVDLIDIILVIEKKFEITIPDEVTLNSVDDFVYFIQDKGTSAPLGTQ